MEVNLERLNAYTYLGLGFSAKLSINNAVSGMVIILRRVQQKL